MGVKFFEDGNALESLRSSDFDALSAYGEVLDNSIQAGAKNIAVDFVTSNSGRFVAIDKLVFGDDGAGMDASTIASCLKLGWSSRFNDRKGIGRFGVGMVLGAIHEVKRITVISKIKSGSGWLTTYVDLDEVAAGEQQEIPEPVATTLPEAYKHRVGVDSGTLVIWEKYDRQKVGADKIREEAHHYFGRTFRKFIWDGLRITIDGEAVKAHDPLYHITAKTRFPNDPPAKLFEPILIKWPVRPELRSDFGEFSEIKIQLSFLPEAFRQKQGDGGSAAAKERKIDEYQQGLSILRENREVFFGQVPYWSSVKIGDSGKGSWRFEDLDRWWGCEISFGAELDASFEVKNIKRGARPEAELLQLIKESIHPTRKSILELVRELWTKNKREEEAAAAETADDLGRHSGHTQAESAAAQGTTLRSKYDPDKSVEDVVSEVQQDHLSHMEEARQQRYLELLKAQPYVIADSTWRGPTFWEVTHGGSKIFMNYNVSHEFFVELRTLEDRILEETEPDVVRELTQRITSLVDLLLISYAKAEATQDPDSTMSVRELNESMNITWGQCLKSFINAFIKQESK